MKMLPEHFVPTLVLWMQKLVNVPVLAASLVNLISVTGYSRLMATDVPKRCLTDDPEVTNYKSL